MENYKKAHNQLYWLTTHEGWKQQNKERPGQSHMQGSEEYWRKGKNHKTKQKRYPITSAKASLSVWENIDSFPGFIEKLRLSNRSKSLTPATPHTPIT